MYFFSKNKIQIFPNEKCKCFTPNKTVDNKNSLRHNFQLIRHFVSKNVTIIGNCFNRFYFDYKSIFNKFFIALIMTEIIAQIHLKLNTKVNHWFFFFYRHTKVLQTHSEILLLLRQYFWVSLLNAFLSSIYWLS